jgi:uncharacterized protein (UPF0335 family)
MTRRKGKSVSFDAMVKFFMHHYHIPTKKDVENIIARIDRLEKLLKSSQRSKGRRSPARSAAADGQGTPTITASDTVLDIVQNFKQGVGFAEIQTKTGYDEKKLRNIIYRLNNLGKIKRIARGKYIAPAD